MDPWKILGVEKGASKEVIQKAYREKVRKHHPDMGGDDWAFHQVQEAYETLTDPEKAKKKRQPQKRPSSSSGSARPDPGGRDAKNQSANRQRQPDQQTQQPRRKKYNQPPQSSTTYRKSFQRSARGKEPSDPKPDWKNFFFGSLPLQSETTYFILANVLDIFMTNKLLQFQSAKEANPIADYFIQRWGFAGAIVFKLAIVAFVCIIAQIVAMKKLKMARALLIGGTILVGFVVAYSIWLYIKHFA